MGFLKDARIQIFISTALLSLVIFVYARLVSFTDTSLIIELTQLYALTTTVYLYIFLLIPSLIYFFKSQAKYFEIIKKPVLYSATFFASLHSGFAFFGELGSFEGLFFLNNSYLLAISLSFTSLLILILLSLNLKKLHALELLIYPAVLFIVIHALMLGSHFANLSGAIPQIFILALCSLIILESLRLDRFLNQKYTLPKIGGSFAIAMIIVSVFLTFQFLPQGSAPSLSVHEVHKQLAKEAQSGLPDYLKNLPGMQGDKTKRFVFDIDAPSNIQPNVPVVFRFRVYDASTGAPVNFFDINYTKIMHLIVVDSSLTSFQHLHPEFKEGFFEIPVTFPFEGRFNLYADFVPKGAIEQQFGFLEIVGKPSEIKKAVIEESPQYSKNFGNYGVKMSFDSPLLASDLSVGAKQIKFTLSDKNGNPITTLKPYLGTFGHMVMINTDTYEYLHVHPLQTKTVTPDQIGGPEVIFSPVGIYGPIKPGNYKVFAEFNPDGNLITTDFIVKVQ